MFQTLYYKNCTIYENDGVGGRPVVMAWKDNKLLGMHYKSVAAAKSAITQIRNKEHGVRRAAQLDRLRVYVTGPKNISTV